jgi:hypothetical protein
MCRDAPARGDGLSRISSRSPSKLDDVRGACASFATLGVLIVLALLPATSSAFCFRVSGSRGAVCLPASKKPKKMVLNISVEGEYIFVHDQTGVDQNACSTITGMTPNHAHSELLVRLKVDWPDVTVPFGPIHGKRIPVIFQSAGSSTIHGTYAFSGYAYDEGCHQVSWPAGGGAACSGSFGAPGGEGGSDLWVNSLAGPKPDSNHVNVLLTPAQLIAGGLVLQPPGCQDNGNPSNFHTFGSAFGEGFEVPDTHVSLNVAESGHGVGGYSFASGTVASQVEYPVGFTLNCSQPSSQLTCMQSWDPPGAAQSAVAATTVHVERIRVIK